MKITVSINLNGRVFTIDEDAYQHLRSYLDAVSGQFADNSDREEILCDIESRVAELLGERLSASKQSVTMGDIDEIIGIMGKPRDFGTGDQSTDNPGAQQRTTRENRRLYRDPDNRIIGGVASGIAMWVHIDPVIVRVLFVVTFFMFGPLLYIILWIIIPLARTPAQKLEMRGENVTIDTIEQVIKEEFSNMKDRWQDLKKKEKLERIEDLMGQLGQRIVDLVVLVGKIFASILVVGFVVVLVGFLITASSLFPLEIFSHTLWLGNSQAGTLKTLLSTLITPSYANLLAWGILLSVSATLLSIIVGLGRFITGSRRGFWFINSVLFVAWLAGLGCTTGALVMEGMKLKSRGTVISTHDLSAKAGDTLRVKLTGNTLPGEGQVERFENFGNFEWTSNGKMLTCSGGQVTYAAEPELSVVPSTTGTSYFSIELSARGSDTLDATNNARTIAYQWQTQPGILSLSPVLTQVNKRWRNPTVHISLHVAPGTFVIFENGAEYLSNGMYQGWRTYSMGKELE